MRRTACLLKKGMSGAPAFPSLEQFTTPGSQTHQASPILRKKGMTGTPAFPSLKQQTTLGSQPHFSHARLWLDIRASPTDGRLSPTPNTPSDTNRNAYMACATTGEATVIINGVQVHSTFKLSTAPGEGRLWDGNLNSSRVVLRNVRYIIVDEVSTTSSNIVSKVNDRQQQITGKYNKPIGILNVIMSDDLRQLPPARASEVFECSKYRKNIFNTKALQVVHQKEAIFSTALRKADDELALTDEELRTIESQFVTKAESLCR